MSVYVDEPIFEWRGRSWAHLMADSTPELHAFAARLGLKREWFQPGRRAERDHYDVTESKRKQALALGAIAETMEEGSARRKARRQRVVLDA